MEKQNPQLETEIQQYKREIIFDRRRNYKQSVNLQQHGKGCYSITVTNENTIQAKKIAIY